MPLAPIVRLADQLERELHRPGVRRGDRYPDTEAIARRLGVSTGRANAALRVLAQRGILDRRRRRGTFIARLPGDGPRPVLRRIHVLVPPEYLQLEGLLGDGLLIGMQGALPGAEIHFNFGAAWQTPAEAQRLVADALHAAEPAGFVLVRAPLAVQRAVQASGLPAVVLGSLQPSIVGLAWIDRDQRAVADLAAEHLLASGCRRIAALFRAEMGAGDFLALDRLQERLEQARLKPTALTVRCLPPDAEAIRDVVRAVLAGKHPTPQGLVCRSSPLAEGVLAAAEELGLRRRRDFELVVLDLYLKAGQTPPAVPYVRSLLDSHEIGRRVGDLLARQARRQPIDPHGQQIPVTLEVPPAPRRGRS